MTKAINAESQETLSERNCPTYFIEGLNLKFIKKIMRTIENRKKYNHRKGLAFKPKP